MTGFTVRCDRCGLLLDEPGGLLFGPPNDAGQTTKRHICTNCYPKILDTHYDEDT